MSRKNSPKIKSKPTFAIVVDGECEVWYLQMLKRNEKSLRVNIEPKIPQRKKLTEQYETVIKLAKDYSKVFWIVDFDVIVSETKNKQKGSISALSQFCNYKRCIEKKYNNVVLIINNPCLELWLLLHFEHTSKIFPDCKTAEKQLKKHLHDYEKIQEYYTKEGRDIYLKLKSKLKVAIKNSKLLGKMDPSNPYNSISEMHLFFESPEFKNLFN